MNVGQIMELAISTLAEYGLIERGWRVEWDNGKRRAGACHYNRRVISLSRIILPTAPDGEIQETILHEIAHALTPGHNHDEVWRAKLIEMGGTGSRTHSMETPKGRYEVVCVHCGVIGNRHQAQGTWKRLVNNPSGATHVPFYTHRKCGQGLWLRDTKSTRPIVNIPTSHVEIPVIEVFVPAASEPKKTPATRTGKQCLCGCGEMTGSNYRPGHDARHVSKVFAQWLASDIDTTLAMERFAHAPKLAAKLHTRIESHANRNYKEN